MGRPRSDLADYLEWQGRLERYRVSDLDLNLFCLQEGVSRSTFYRWKNRLKEGIPESIESPATLPDGVESDESVFVPPSLKATAVEIELPNGGLVRLPADVGNKSSVRHWRKLIWSRSMRQAIRVSPNLRCFGDESCTVKERE